MVQGRLGDCDFSRCSHRLATFRTTSSCMDIFNAGAVFGSESLDYLLCRLVEVLGVPSQFLPDVHMEIMSRLIPAKHLAILCTPYTNKLCQPNCPALPLEYAQMIRMSATPATDSEPIAMAVAEVVVVVMCNSMHFSGMVLDLVDRVYYRFDSFPDSGHAALQHEMATNLTRMHVLMQAEPAGTVDFVQPETECGIYVLAMAIKLEEALANRNGNDRGETIMGAMQLATDPVQVREVRGHLCNHMHELFLLLHSAKSPKAESLAQESVLGPMCSRRALRGLFMENKPTVEQLVQALCLVAPPSRTVVMHRMKAGGTVVGAEAAARLLGASLGLVVMLDKDLTRVVGAFLTMSRTEDRPPLVFVPTGLTVQPVLASLEAVTKAIGGRRVEIRVDGFSCTNISAALPLMILSWWAMNGIGVSEDELPEKVVATAARVCNPTVRRPNSGHDWFFRQLVANSLNEGFRRIAPMYQASRNDPTLARALDAVRDLLCLDANSAIARIGERQRRDEALDALLDRLADSVDAVLDYAKLHAPWRWALEDSNSLKTLYLEIVEKHLSYKRLVELTDTAIRVARDVSQMMDTESGAFEYIAMMVRALYRQWPVALVTPLHEGTGLISYAPTDEQFDDAIRYTITQSREDPVHVIMCPVVLLWPDGTNSAVPLDMIPAMNSRDELVPVIIGEVVPALSRVCSSRTIGGQLQRPPQPREDGRQEDRPEFPGNYSNVRLISVSDGIYFPLAVCKPISAASAPTKTSRASRLFSMPPPSAAAASHDPMQL